MKRSIGWVLLASAGLLMAACQEGEADDAGGNIVAEGRRLYEEAYVIKRNDPEAAKLEKRKIKELIKKGVLLSKQNKMSEAAELFKQALEEDPSNCDALIYLGICYAKMGRAKDAAHWYGQFIETCPGDMRASQARRALKQFEEYKKGR